MTEDIWTITDSNALSRGQGCNIPTSPIQYHRIKSTRVQGRVTNSWTPPLPTWQQPFTTHDINKGHGHPPTGHLCVCVCVRLRPGVSSWAYLFEEAKYIPRILAYCKEIVICQVRDVRPARRWSATSVLQVSAQRGHAGGAKCNAAVS